MGKKVRITQVWRNVEETTMTWTFQDTGEGYNALVRRALAEQAPHSVKRTADGPVTCTITVEGINE